MRSESSETNVNSEISDLFLMGLSEGPATKISDCQDPILDKLPRAVKARIEP
jgi:hypothetical protein